MGFHMVVKSHKVDFKKVIEKSNLDMYELVLIQGIPVNLEWA